MVNSITKEINLVFNAEVKSSKKGFAGTVSRDTEETQSEVNKKVKKAVNAENIVTILTESLMAMPKMVAQILPAAKIIIPAIMLAFTAIPIIGKIFSYFDKFNSTEESDLTTDKSSALGDTSDLMKSMTEEPGSGISNTVSNENQGMSGGLSESLSAPSPVMETTPVNTELSTDSSNSTPTQSKLEPIEQEAKTIVTADITDFERKVSTLNSLDMTTGINNLTAAISKSVNDEKKDVLSLFPVYENFANLLAKIVGQLQFIANPSTNTSQIDKTMKQYSESSYGTNSATYKSLYATIDNGNESTVANAPPATRQTMNNIQQTTSATEF